MSQKVGRAEASLMDVREGQPQLPFCAVEQEGLAHQGRGVPPPRGGELVSDSVEDLWTLVTSWRKEDLETSSVQGQAQKEDSS